MLCFLLFLFFVNLFNALPFQRVCPDGVVPTSQPNVARSVCHAGKPSDKTKGHWQKAPKNDAFDVSQHK